jgi:hypothetical protein
MRQRNIIVWGLLFTLLIVSASGCKTTPAANPVQVPEWLTTTPYDDRYFYAVGVSGQTRSIKDAWNQATQRARAELGRTIITQVASKDLVISTNESDYSRQVIEAMSDTELHFTEIIGRWNDQIGEYGPPNHYYVLVRMEKKRAEKLLKRIK